jgi:hypothetical protein
MEFWRRELLPTSSLAIPSPRRGEREGLSRESQRWRAESGPELAIFRPFDIPTAVGMSNPAWIRLYKMLQKRVFLIDFDTFSSWNYALVPFSSHDFGLFDPISLTIPLPWHRHLEGLQTAYMDVEGHIRYVICLTDADAP